MLTLIALGITLIVIASLSAAENLQNGLRPLPEWRDRNLKRIFFVGDTHADSFCAQSWIRRTGLIDFESNPWRWTGDNESDALVFLGDYVDKGITARRNLETIRAVQQAFPDRVVAIVGNHDLFALIDTVLDPKVSKRPMRYPVSQYAYSFVHPQEFTESGWSPARHDDDELLAALLTALQLVYSKNYESKLLMPDIFEQVPPFNRNASLGRRMKERFQTWEQEYAQGMVDSGLLEWLAKQPIVAAVGDALLVHGGVSASGLRSVLNRASAQSVQEVLHDKTNEAYWVRTFSNMLHDVISLWC